MSPMFLCLKYKEYVSYVPMSKNNTMTHMYRTILLALPALLLLAACADDVTTPADPADTLAGQPVRFTATGLAVTPADAPRTRATQETDFPAEGSTMTVYMTGDGNTWQADYTYTSDGWTSDAPLLWPDTQNEYTFTAISPNGTDPEITLPTEWTAETLAEHEEIRTTAEEVKTTAKQNLDLPLRHALVKVQVISISGQPVTLTTTTADGTEFMTLYSPDNGVTYEGYVLPSETGFSFLTDQVYTVDKELEAGTVVTTWDDTEAVRINCPEPGKLSEAWTGNPQKVVITGTLDDTDMRTINGHKDEITHLYVMGGSINGNDWKSLNMSGATQLESVYLAEATSIGDFAFQNCSALTSVSLPQAESIGIDAFLQCSELTSVSLPKATSIGEMAFQNCSALTSVCLPKATTIGDIAFEQCSALESISLPEATSIGNNAFQLCEQLTSVSLPEATSIGNYAFRECSELTSVSLPEATSIGNYAFASCSQLASVSLPKATSIGDNAFYDCGALTSVSLPKNANIENNAFEACYKLTTLFLSNCPETEFDATEYNNNPNYGNHGWTTIHYGYIGTDGDYLKESNYAYHWPNN